jgi:hypothetical protein
VTGFEQASIETLTVIRDNLVRGLDEVAAALADGTFETVGPKGAAPPSQSGQTTLALLAGIDAELESRVSSSGGPVPHGTYAVTLGAWSRRPARPRA